MTTKKELKATIAALEVIAELTKKATKPHRHQKVYYKRIWPAKNGLDQMIRYGWECIDEGGYCDDGYSGPSPAGLPDEIRRELDR